MLTVNNSFEITRPWTTRMSYCEEILAFLPRAMHFSSTLNSFTVRFRWNGYLIDAFDDKDVCDGVVFPKKAISYLYLPLMTRPQVQLIPTSAVWLSLRAFPPCLFEAKLTLLGWTPYTCFRFGFDSALEWCLQISLSQYKTSQRACPVYPFIQPAWTPSALVIDRAVVFIRTLRLVQGIGNSLN